MRFSAFSSPTRRWRKTVPMRQFEYPQPSLFDENKSRVELPPAQKLELATLVKLLLLEIATVLANGEIGNDQDHV
jgi:hypothetical protein